MPRAVVILSVAVTGVACADAPAPRPEAPPTTVPATSAPTLPGEVTIVGTVQAGVEPRCFLLPHAGQSYLLLGGDPALIRPGAHIVVRGRPEPRRVTTCMQGVPFHVIEARPAGHR